MVWSGTVGYGAVRFFKLRVKIFKFDKVRWGQVR